MSSDEKVIQTICGICPANCGIRVYVKNRVIDRIEADPENPASEGALCIKAKAYKELVYSPQRLKYPLKKAADGFKRISWDEALDTIASKLLEIKERYGAETLVSCTGAPFTEETRDGFIQLLAAYGSPNYTNPGHLCSMPRRLGLELVYGGKGYARSAPDYWNTRCMIIWGANPTASMRLSEWLAGNVDKEITDAKARGAKLIVVDPMYTSIAAMAYVGIQINPGTDSALGLAMLNVIIGEQLYDREFVDNWSIGFEELREHVQQSTPEWAEKITGVPADRIRQVARTYATTRPALIRDGNGLDQHTNVVDTVRIIAMLTAITGNLDVPGGNVFFPLPERSRYPTLIPKVKRLGADRHPLYDKAPFSSVIDAILTGKPYQPRALIVYNCNPLLINANEKRVRKALEKLELLVAFDTFMSATAELAHIILPEATDLERFGHRIYFSPKGGLVTLRQKVMEPIGESRPVFEVEYELARRMGVDKFFPWKTTEEWIDYRLKPTGITVEQLKKQPFMYATPPVEYRKYLKSGFSTPSKKVELYSEKVKNHGYDPLPVYREPTASLASRPELADKYPLVATTRRYASYVHTRFRNLPMLQEMHPAPLVRIHPEDARQRGIREGDETIVESPEGSIRVKAKLTTEILPGLVAVDFGWGNPGDGGANVNILTSDDDRCPFSGATSNRRLLCQVTKA